MKSIQPPTTTVEQTTRYAEMFSALGSESRLSILRLLLTAHPEGMVVGDIQTRLEIAPSTLSHHLERLKTEGLITVRRDSTFLWCAANTAALEELLGFLFAECCTRSKAVSADALIKICDLEPRRKRP